MTFLKIRERFFLLTHLNPNIKWYVHGLSQIRKSYGSKSECIFLQSGLLLVFHLPQTEASCSQWQLPVDSPHLVPGHLDQLDHGEKQVPLLHWLGAFLKSTQEAQGGKGALLPLQDFIDRQVQSKKRQWHPWCPFSAKCIKMKTATS